jgi:hypothetical protein
MSRATGFIDRSTTARAVLLDEVRLPFSELEAKRQEDPRKYRILYQQQDVDRAGALIDEAWITGGTDREGFVVPGCLDEDRGFLEWPDVDPNEAIDHVCVDPSAGEWWAIE